MTGSFAKVIIDISHEKVDRPFEYRIPDEIRDRIEVGVLVTVPFGAGNSPRKGYVVGICDTPDFDEGRIKTIAGVVTEGVSVQSQLIQLAWWMRQTYGSTMNQALKTVLPVKQKIRPRERKLLRCRLAGEELRAAIQTAEHKKHRARARILSAFLEADVIPFEVAQNQLHITPSSLKPLLESGILLLEKSEIYRNPLRELTQERDKPSLNSEQQNAVDRFCEDYQAGIRKTYLLYGITGSGKTEVYMELMERVLGEGKQIILLIPEIALTYQTVMRFYRRFGDCISIINSRLSAGERYDQWQRAIKGEVSIMIGPRSALFTPFPNLGLVIMDEEHEGAYKSETMPRFHARDAAEKRAELSRASLVLGSATPSLEAYTKALKGEYGLFKLTARAVRDSRLADVEVADLRRELAEGNKTMFSRRLRELMEERLENQEQIMLFINRRGYSNFVSCRSCGEAVRCPHCDVSLTLHKNGRLVCHYCGYSIPMVKSCPKCGSPFIAGFGVGTQKLEEMTKAMFPDARVLRMDADTTSKKGGHEELLAAFGSGDADILIGTQMIVKGHDFKNVTLVGIMAADLSLNTPDYRCAERTFQLLTQAAGRAGRGGRRGSVVIQTYCPEHYSIETAQRQDYEAFYGREMMFRQLMNYPPVCRMLAVLLQAPDERQLEICSARCALLAEQEADQRAPAGEERQVQIIGPVKAPVYKVNDMYRKILYIKSQNCDILDKIRSILEDRIAGEESFRRVMAQYDIS